VHRNEPHAHTGTEHLLEVLVTPQVVPAEAAGGGWQVAGGGWRVAGIRICRARAWVLAVWEVRVESAREFRGFRECRIWV
jgi:hypothetical protein